MTENAKPRIKPRITTSVFASKTPRNLTFPRGCPDTPFSAFRESPSLNRRDIVSPVDRRRLRGHLRTRSRDPLRSGLQIGHRGTEDTEKERARSGSLIRCPKRRRLRCGQACTLSRESTLPALIARCPERDAPTETHTHHPRRRGLRRTPLPQSPAARQLHGVISRRAQFRGQPADRLHRPNRQLPHVGVVGRGRVAEPPLSVFRMRIEFAVSPSLTRNCVVALAQQFALNLWRRHPDEVDHQRGVESGVWIANVSPRVRQNPRPTNPVILRLVDVAVNPKQWGMLFNQRVEV